MMERKPNLLDWFRPHDEKQDDRAKNIHPTTGRWYWDDVLIFARLL
jgi:hypothetical protein